MKTETKIKYARRYHGLGFSLIPVSEKTKRPLIKWAQYQKEPASMEIISEWFHKWPSSGIGIITGEISDLLVVDVDSKEGQKAIFEFINDDLAMPVVQTPRGLHLYFRGNPEIRNGVQVLKDCDVRSNGGYVIAPSGKNGYSWVDGCSVFDGDIPELPSYLKDILLYPPQAPQEKVEVEGNFQTVK